MNILANLSMRLEATAERVLGAIVGRPDQSELRGNQAFVSAKIGFLSWLISFFLFAPALWTIFEPGRLAQSRAGNFLNMCHDPLTRELGEPILAYRITTPIICWLLRLPDWLCLLFPWLFTIGALGFVYHSVSSRTSRPFGALAALGVACTYAVITPNIHPGIPDGVTHFVTALCLVVVSPWLVATLSVFATMNDERFVTAIPFILLWQAWPSVTFREGVGRTWRLTIGFIAGLLVVWVIRHALTVGWIGPGISKPEVYTGMETFWRGFPAWVERWGVTFLINIFCGWRGLWLVWIVGMWMVWKSGPRWWITLLGIGTCIAVLETMVVADVSRSIGYVFPALLCVLVAAHRQAPAMLHRSLLWSVVFCLITPGFYLLEDVQWSRPLPLSLLRWLTGWDVIHLLR